MNFSDFNFKRVHFGLGKTQQKILDILGDTQRDMLGIKVLATRVYHPELERSCDEGYNYTKSQYNSVSRAVRSLEESGLVRTDTIPIRQNGRQVNVKVVGLPKSEKESK